MEHSDNPERLIFRLVYIIKRLTDKASADQLANLISGDFNVTYMPYFMSIGHNGISNHDLVIKIMVTKQAVSKTVKELERLGLVYTGKSETDARSIMIFLTEEGKTLHKAIKVMADEMTERYIKLIGAKKYEQFIDTLIMLIDFHEKLEQRHS